MATELAAGVASREVVETTEPRPGRLPLLRAWSWLWPKLAAIALVLAAWQATVWSGWQPDYVLPGPAPVFQRLAQDLRDSNFDLGIAITMRRAFSGYAIAVAIGSVAGILIARIVVLRRAIGSAIFGLQSMPSIVWFPVALLLFGLNEKAIFFVVILGAAPSIAAVFNPIRAAPLITAGLVGPDWSGRTGRAGLRRITQNVSEKRGNSEVWRTNLQ